MFRASLGAAAAVARRGIAGHRRRRPPQPSNGFLHRDHAASASSTTSFDATAALAAMMLLMITTGGRRIDYDGDDRDDAGGVMLSVGGRGATCQGADDLGVVGGGMGGGGGMMRYAVPDDDDDYDGRRRRAAAAHPANDATWPTVIAPDDRGKLVDGHGNYGPSPPYANFVDSSIRVRLLGGGDGGDGGAGGGGGGGDGDDDHYFVATSSTASVSVPPASSSPSTAAYRDLQRLRRAVTSRRMADERSRRSFLESYEVEFDDPLGSGAYGDVYLCRDRSTGEECALKKIPKEYTEHAEFQREMNALLHIRSHGGHPNICMLRENFDEDDDYLLVLDLLDGGEMFEHLIKHGAYSEADASRLLRQVASALDFIHGIGVVHADLKPENIMLRKTTRGDAVIIKLIDFGCSEVLSHEGDGTRLPSSRRTLTHDHGATTAYCPPEAFDDASVPLDPSMDMWALGVIVYMMLLGRHPFDSDCDASDEVIAKRIKEQRQPPLSGGSIAGKLSPSALDLLTKLMEPDPKKRMTAHEMLHHPWVTGETASEYVMEDSAQRLKQLSGYKSGIEKTVIERLLSFSSEESDESSSNNDKRTSLLERAFNHLDKDKKGFLDRKDLKALSTQNNVSSLRRRGTTREEAEHKMSFDHFSDIIGQNMKSIHFKKGQVIYNEDDEGDYMYFINSGTIEVSTKDGFRAKKGQGDMFGKGGIMGRKRRTTITCTTPVNALRIDKDFFSKYVVKGSPLATTLREKANKEKFERALDILERNGNMTERTYKKGEYLFRQGEVPVDAYITKEGLVDITFAEHHIYSAKPGRLFGINSQALSRNRKASAVCATDTCVIKCMSLNELQKLSAKFPVLKSTLKELALRQEFRRAVVIRRMRSFPNKQQLKEAFDDIDMDRSGTLNKAELSQLMQSLGAAFSDSEMASLISTLSLNDSGEVDFLEFEQIFSEN